MVYEGYYQTCIITTCFRGSPKLYTTSITYSCFKMGKDAILICRVEPNGKITYPKKVIKSRL